MPISTIGEAITRGNQSSKFQSTRIRAANGPNSAISLKQTFNRIFVTGNILEYKKQKTEIGEQSCIVQTKCKCTDSVTVGFSPILYC